MTTACFILAAGAAITAGLAIAGFCRGQHPGGMAAIATALTAAALLRHHRS